MYSLLQRQVDSDTFRGYLKPEGADGAAGGPASAAGADGGGVAMELVNLDDIIHLEDDEINEAVILSQQSFWTPEADGGTRRCGDAAEEDVLSAEIYINREACAGAAGGGEAACTLVLRDKDAGIADDYVLVEMSDVVDAMAHFIAAYVMVQPKAKTISPEELHGQLKVTFRGTARARGAGAYGARGGGDEPHRR